MSTPALQPVSVLSPSTPNIASTLPSGSTPHPSTSVSTSSHHAALAVDISLSAAMMPVGPSTSSSGRGTTHMASNSSASAMRSIDADVEGLEARLDALESLGIDFYDAVENALCPSGDSRYTYDCLARLTSHLSSDLLPFLAKSTIGALSLHAPSEASTRASGTTTDRDSTMAGSSTPSGTGPGRPGTENGSTPTPPPFEAEIGNLEQSGKTLYDSRMRLREGAGMVAHVLSGVNLGGVGGSATRTTART